MLPPYRSDEREQLLQNFTNATRADKTANVTLAARRKSSWLIRCCSGCSPRSSSRARHPLAHAAALAVTRYGTVAADAGGSRRPILASRAPIDLGAPDVEPAASAVAGHALAALGRWQDDSAGDAPVKAAAADRRCRLARAQSAAARAVRRGRRQGQGQAGHAGAGRGALDHRARAVRARGGRVPRRQGRAGRRSRAPALQPDARAAHQAALRRQRLDRLETTPV